MARADSRLGSDSSSTSNSLPFGRSVDRPPTLCLCHAMRDQPRRLGRPTDDMVPHLRGTGTAEFVVKSLLLPRPLVAPPRIIGPSICSSCDAFGSWSRSQNPPCPRAWRALLHSSWRSEGRRLRGGPPGRAALRKRPAAHAAAGRDERTASAGQPRCAAVFGNSLFAGPAAVPILQRAMACQGCGSMRDDEP